MKYIVLIIVVSCLAAGCAAPRPISDGRALATGEDEQRLWRRAREEQAAIGSSGLLYRDAEVENYLAGVARKLGDNSISPEISFQIKVIKDPNLNAFALPNGVIYVHSGILARMDNEAQLAALLGHEIIHCTHRHSLRTLKSFKDQPASAGPIRQTAAKTGMGRNLLQVLGVNESMAVLNGYTRGLETEADRIGLDLVVKANYDPRETLTLFDLLKQEIGFEGITEACYFGTHPNVQKRIENINAWLAEKYQANMDTGIKNTRIYQSKMARVMLDNAALDLQEGRFFVAQRTVKKYLAVKPCDAHAYFLLGEICRQRGGHGDTQEAINYYEKAISLNPSFPEPYKALGLIHFKVGEKRLAKKFFESTLLFSPDTSDKAYIEKYLKLCKPDGEG